MLSCTDHMFLVFELSTWDCVEMEYVLFPRTDHMILQNVLILLHVIKVMNRIDLNFILLHIHIS